MKKTQKEREAFCPICATQKGRFDFHIDQKTYLFYCEKCDAATRHILLVPPDGDRWQNPLTPDAE